MMRYEITYLDPDGYREFDIIECDGWLELKEEIKKLREQGCTAIWAASAVCQPY